MRDMDLSLPSGAIFSDDRTYRYALWRVWSSFRPFLMVIGLNPSTANEVKTDPTITRLIIRADRDGFGGLLMGNLYAYVSTWPKVLLTNKESVGEFNDSYLRLMISLSGRQLCGWGSFPPVKRRAPEVLEMMKEPYCLGTNADGEPTHPLYIAYETAMMPYKFKTEGVK